MLEQLDIVTSQAHHLVQILADVPKPGTGEAPPGAGDKMLTILKWIAWGATFCCVGGLLGVAAKMAIAHGQGRSTQVAGLGWVAGACVLVGSASAIVGVLVS